MRRKCLFFSKQTCVFLVLLLILNFFEKKGPLSILTVKA